MRKLSVLFLALGLAACGASPEEQCNVVYSSICSVFFECHYFTSEESCVESHTVQVDCARATGVSSGYDTCIADIAALTCPGAQWPESCKGIIEM